jgi:hypothetical protein
MILVNPTLRTAVSILLGLNRWREPRFAPEIAAAGVIDFAAPPV